MDTNHNKNDLKPMSLMSVVLSLLSLFVISGILFSKHTLLSRELLISIDTTICALFLVQLTLDLFRAPDRMAYMKVHWIDYLASIPMIEPLRYARIFQILRVIRLLRSGQYLWQNIQKNRKEATFASILFLLVILLTVGSGTILWVEGNEPTANIKSSADALWWAFVTISTVGYGDHFPVTDLGKVVAAVIIICGVSIFGMISGLVTSIITKPTTMANRHNSLENQQIETIIAQQDEILKKIDQLEKRLDDRRDVHH
jgi:voltage-gated potassium channel